MSVTKLIVRNTYNAKAIATPRGKELESVNPDDNKSMTIPGEAYSIQELLQRAQSGQPLMQNTVVQYMDQEDLDKITHFYRQGLDLTDIDELRQATNQQAQLLNEAIDTAKAEKAAAEKIIADRAQAELDQEALRQQQLVELLCFLLLGRCRI